MKSIGKYEIIRGIVLQNDNVAYQPRTPHHSLEEIVAKQRILGHTPGHTPIERSNIVNSLSDVDPLSKQILIYVRHGPSVQVEPHIPGENSGEQGSVRTRWRRLGPRLKNRIPVDHPICVRLEFCTVQGMGKRTD